MKKSILFLLFFFGFAGFTYSSQAPSAHSSLPDYDPSLWKVNVCVNIGWGKVASINACMDFKCGTNMYHIFGCNALRIINSTTPNIYTMNDVVDYAEQQEGIPSGTLTELVISSNSVTVYNSRYYIVVPKSYPLLLNNGEYTVELEMQDITNTYPGPPTSTQ